MNLTNIMLRISAGPGMGTCRVVNPGQTLLVGTSKECGWILDDSSIDDVVFAIECARQGCWVEGQGNGRRMKVNGMTTNRRKLCDGDIISAGACSFIARLRGLSGALQNANVPLVGTAEFAQRFRGGAAARISGTWTRSTRQSTVVPFSWRKSLPGPSLSGPSPPTPSPGQ